MFSLARPSSFVCLCARLLKNACVDLDEKLRVDRCRDIKETRCSAVSIQSTA